jgi:low affinity Fe/Cu permease
VASFFKRVASRAPGIVGSPWTFLLTIVAVALWLAAGPIFDWSSSWVLWPATVTSIGAFVLVILLQYTQNRDTRAVQLKLDEIIRGLETARTQLVRLEHLSDEELDRIEEEFSELKEQAQEDAVPRAS